jgi:hypothetical protein
LRIGVREVAPGTAWHGKEQTVSTAGSVLLAVTWLD